MLSIKFQWNVKGLSGLQEDIRSYARFVTPAQKFDVIEDDPPDNLILECAVAAESDFIVSGDVKKEQT